MKKEHKILFLSTRLAGYFVNCINTLRQIEGVEIMVIHWPMIDNAPFRFNLEGIRVIDKSKVNLKVMMEACIRFKPSLVYIAGWNDKNYLKIAKSLKEYGAVTIGGLDNPWRGTLKQRIGAILSPLLVRPYFDFLWVAGKKQYQFAKRLGYNDDKILYGVYAADLENFNQPVKTVFNKYLLYVGRFEREKCVLLLVRAFLSLTEEERNGWTLRMVGNGSQRDVIDSSANIKVENFLQPDLLAATTRDAGGFILPSSYEPWGVVVQEFAAAGLPLLLSDAVNAGEKFLISGENGYVFEARNLDALKKTLIIYFQLDQKTLTEMGQRSNALAHKLTSKHWVSELMSVTSNFKVHSN